MIVNESYFTLFGVFSLVGLSPGCRESSAFSQVRLFLESSFHQTFSYNSALSSQYMHGTVRKVSVFNIALSH